MRILILLSCLVLLSASCSVSPQPIQYGEDNCVHCEMTIMDRRYGTEVVNSNGKAYKFDSVECLMEFLEEHKEGEEEFKLVLFTDYEQPEKLVNAYESHVLHSKSLPSPMGMFLTAFENESVAMSYKEQLGGKVYCWDGLTENFEVIKKKGVD